MENLFHIVEGWHNLSLFQALEPKEVHYLLAPTITFVWMFIPNLGRLKLGSIPLWSLNVTVKAVRFIVLLVFYPWLGIVEALKNSDLVEPKKEKAIVEQGLERVKAYFGNIILLLALVASVVIPFYFFALVLNKANHLDFWLLLHHLISWPIFLIIHIEWALVIVVIYGVGTYVTTRKK